MTSPRDGADCHRSSRQSPVYAIIIPAYNEAQELPATLVAVRRAMATQGLPGECIVVDNHSSDDTSAVAKAGGADRVVYEPVNQIARARNAGVAASKAEFLIFVDADTRIEPPLLTKALHLLRGGLCVGGGAVVHFEGETSGVGRFALGLWKRISLLTRTAAGSFFFCRRDAFQAVGGFDLRLYAAEEVLLSRDLRKWGRTRGQTFVIITDPPVTTSARKLRWYSDAQIVGWIFFMALMPFAVFSRRLCRYWYERPQRKHGSSR
ncbi:glycosyltransferase [Desulfofustis glycolicus]|uniref:Glycosyltransferase involved in cell wall bisynthesis n=1 Tax=Desulfofustis glycolicus DSM 9705 TaxID=1121409 RepID=A0A1M5X5F4_9BACT|nr:glycosyltransferase [Desulfofustis glycolicus]MCB2216105.1 glycosyltransferase [Desulfobulbaceae bacterium]SHH94724.1 Glycosyltransferase involved in cell wall bisynthesis [Desulfofustis glycolicus DSM 9705]